MNKKDLIILLIVPILLASGIWFFTIRPSGQIAPESGIEEATDASQLADLDKGKQEASEEIVLDSGSKKEIQLPKMEIDENKNYTAVLKTSLGIIKVELFADKTPITANNFVSLARKNYYDGTIFHRVIKGFMIQGGDPKGDGTGGPGYRFDDEPFDGEYSRGTVAMANAGPNTNGSQFFIIHQDYDLPKNYVIFGQVVEGMGVVDKIAESPTKPSSSGENSTPVEPIVVESVEIIEDD